MKKREPVRQSITASALLLTVLFLLPAAMAAPIEQTAPRQETEFYEPPRQAGETVLQVLDKGKVREMDLETYLAGVLRAEMPASFHIEALKAQTVAARTYTLCKLRNEVHGAGADICTDAACCQAYLDEAAARENWGENAGSYEKIVRRAVAETDGEVVLYGGEPILAVFHSSSAGLTRGAEAVWSKELPYLRPVDSPEQEDLVPNYYSRATFTEEELRERILDALPQANLAGEVSDWLESPVTDEAGSVETMRVGGISVRGSEVRTMLGLRSACFTWEAGSEGITFFVTGYGHGVGLSQYGAEIMAAEGADYREILTHYYTGTSIAVWNG